MATQSIFQHAERKKRLKGLLEKGSEIHEQMETEDQLVTVQKISKIIHESDAINSSVSEKELIENTTEIAMDAQILKMNHDLIGEVLKMGQTEFTEQEFLNAITSLVFKDDNENWDTIAEIAVGMAKTSKFSSCLLGSFDHEPIVVEKVVKERQKRTKATLAQEQRPENVEKVEKQGKGVQKVNLIFRQITKLFIANNHLPIPLYKLVIDPDSYMNTVDNTLQVTFLAKDGNIVFELGQDGYAAVRPAAKAEKESKTDLVHECIKLDKNILAKMTEFYDITEPMIILNRDELDTSQKR